MINSRTVNPCPVSARRRSAPVRFLAFMTSEGVLLALGLVFVLAFMCILTIPSLLAFGWAFLSYSFGLAGLFVLALFVADWAAL